MQNTLQFILSPRFLRVLGFGAVCVVASFMLGIETAGEVQTFSTSEASTTDLGGMPSADLRAGDVNADGSISIEDAILILEIAQGYMEAGPVELKADPNGDNRLTVEDALRILRTVATR